MEDVKKRLEIKEKIYVINEELEINELEEYIVKYIKDKETMTVEEKYNKNTNEIKIFSLDLVKIKFLVLPLKISNYKEKIIIFRNMKSFVNGKIKVDNKEYPFNSHLCFVIFYSSEKKVSFLFEELIENIIEKIDVYTKL